MKRLTDGFRLCDQRSFSLIDYRYGHGYALLRGFPDVDDDLPGGSLLRVMDVVFLGAGRLSCWKDIGAIDLREATGDQRAEIEVKVGGFSSGQRVFLLRSDSVEEYIVSYGLSWAEFDLPGGAESPLVSENTEYRLAHPSVNGEIYTT